MSQNCQNAWVYHQLDKFNLVFWISCTLQLRCQSKCIHSRSCFYNFTISTRRIGFVPHLLRYEARIEEGTYTTRHRYKSCKNCPWYGIECARRGWPTTNDHELARRLDMTHESAEAHDAYLYFSRIASLHHCNGLSSAGVPSHTDRVFHRHRPVHSAYYCLWCPQRSHDFLQLSRRISTHS